MKTIAWRGENGGITPLHFTVCNFEPVTQQVWSIGPHCNLQVSIHRAESLPGFIALTDKAASFYLPLIEAKLPRRMPGVVVVMELADAMLAYEKQISDEDAQRRDLPVR